MARNDKLRKSVQQRREHQRLNAQIEGLRNKAPYIKRLYRLRNVDLPFYDYYDSYHEEFGKVAAEAQENHRSLLGIFEVDDREYFSSESSQHARGFDQIFWHSQQDQNGYGKSADDSNVNGYTNGFRAPDGASKTLVILRQAVPKAKPHREFKYVLKFMALLHELGHVDDMEKEINFHHDAKTFDMIEAEVYAHLYALRRMAEKNYYQCFNMLVEGLKKYLTAPNYLKDVATLTLERMPEYKLVDINAIPLVPTEADLKALGPDGRRALGSIS